MNSAYPDIQETKRISQIHLRQYLFIDEIPDGCQYSLKFWDSLYVIEADQLYQDVFLLSPGRNVFLKNQAIYICKTPSQYASIGTFQLFLPQNTWLDEGHGAELRFDKVVDGIA